MRTTAKAAFFFFSAVYSSRATTTTWASQQMRRQSEGLFSLILSSCSQAAAATSRVPYVLSSMIVRIIVLFSWSSWAPAAVRLGLDAELPTAAASGSLCATGPLLELDASAEGARAAHARRLAAAWLELGLLAKGNDGLLSLTRAGRALLPETLTGDRAAYWLQDRYLRAWMPSVCALPAAGGAEVSAAAPTGGHAAVRRDVFADVGRQPALLVQSRRVLAGYATADWAGIATVLQPALARVLAARGSRLAVVDVGGGSGALLRELACSLPASWRETLELTCVDRPEVVALNAADGADGSAAVTFFAADMFTAPLPRGDVFLLSRVLHDWDDATCIKLLARLRALCNGTTLLIVIDRVATAANPHALLSLHMHLLQGARERRLVEWDALFAAAGWETAEPNAQHAGHTVFALRPMAAAQEASALLPHAHDTLRPILHERLVEHSEGVLLVNHGYPPLYNAGSEIDTQTTALGLRRAGGRWARVAVFSREADVLTPDYGVRLTADTLDPSIPVHLVNNPREVAYSRFACAPIDDAFRAVMASVRPRLVHFGHVNHLSTNLVDIAKREFGAATVFTLHDWFLLCPRGQFLVVGPAPSGVPVLEQCSGQNNEKCAQRCFACRFSSGVEGAAAREVDFWTGWVSERMRAFRALARSVDAFTAPSRHLLERFTAELDVPRERFHLLPYGFDHARLAGRKRVLPAADTAPFVFAYIGRHVPAKGLDLLVRAAFMLLASEPALLGRFCVVVYGRPDGANTESVRRLVASCVAAATRLGVPRAALDAVVSFRPEYKNEDIVRDVFCHVDAIVVPSIWSENAPLVISEALHARVPVVASDAAGMAELVSDGVNGFLFAHRSAASLAGAMHRVLADPAAAARLGARGFLGHPSGDVPSVTDQITRLRDIYDGICGASSRRGK